MLPSTRAFLATLLLLTTGTPHVPAAPPREEVPALADLTDPVRQRLDRAALASPAERVAQRTVDVSGDFVAWLLQRWALRPAEERQAAEEVHRRILADHRGKVLETPAAVTRLFDRLVRELPDPARPREFRYTLTVLDRPEGIAFTTGGGFVYLTRGLLDALAARPEALAFVLGHELGHVALGHCRRGYQLAEIQEEVKRGLRMKLDEGKLKALLETSVAPAGRAIYFLYSREQSHDADRFAFHLCRNAGLDPAAVLDGPRWFAAAEHPALLRGQTEPGEPKLPTLLAYYLSERPDSLRRLKRLLLEHQGQVEDTAAYGLFLYDRATGKLERAADGAVREGAPVVFVHGMHGDLRSFDEFLAYLAGRPEAKGRPLLAFRYPSNGSLAQAGHFLDNEMRRVVRSPQKPSFVCHSAGGLVFRWYAEKRRRPFDRAAMLGTPHTGSRMTAVKFFVDLADFFEDLKLGVPTAILETVNEGKGDLTPDVKPDSLFLRALGHDDERARRYLVVSGRYLGRTRRTALRAAFLAAKVALPQMIRDHVPGGFLQRVGERVIERVELPAEVIEGDLVVSAASARLKGAGRTVELKMHHQDLKKEEEVLKVVADYLFEDR